MVRAEALVEQALEAALISKDRPLLVVGAGAAGATAGIAAARKSVPTLIVDHGVIPFRLQAQCATRWIDPSQYDWPVDHYPVAQYPWAGTHPPPPLAWAGTWANQLGATWSVALARAQQQYPWLSIALRTTSIAPTATNISASGGWTMSFTTAGHSWTASFAMVVWSIGFGEEVHFIPNGYVGFPFWSSDRLLLADYGVPASKKQAIVISGGGDGALQDFLRVVTNPVFRSAREIFTACNIPGWVSSSIHSAEDRAQRAFQWGAGGRYDHAVLKTLHDAHAKLAQLVAQLPQVRIGLQFVLRSNVPAVSLVHGCDHFGNAYGLNRFLVLLIAAHLNRRDLIIDGKRTVAVVGQGHKCVGYVQCHGEDHDVLLASDPDCSQPCNNVPVLPPLKAKVVVIRHGVDRQALPHPKVPDIAIPRQLPPYHFHRT
jgi:hypothetical protein